MIHFFHAYIPTYVNTISKKSILCIYLYVHMYVYTRVLTQPNIWWWITASIHQHFHFVALCSVCMYDAEVCMLPVLYAARFNYSLCYVMHTSVTGICSLPPCWLTLEFLSLRRSACIHTYIIYVPYVMCCSITVQRIFVYCGEILEKCAKLIFKTTL